VIDMETTLWILQGVLAGIFLVTGTTKLTQPRTKMAAGMMTWAAGVTDAQFRAIGAVEVLGAIGLLVPPLMPIAAIGLACTMVGAAATHAGLGEWNRVWVPVLLLGLALFVAMERL
jgi:uncharacterized membrane protein YphA (DoxX/SURF4 family)